jgi:hypothetical protein
MPLDFVQFFVDQEYILFFFEFGEPPQRRISTPEFGGYPCRTEISRPVTYGESKVYGVLIDAKRSS